MNSVASLLTHYRELSLMESVDALLGWDTETQAPPGSMNLRAEQSGALARALYRLRTDSGFRSGIQGASLEAMESAEQRSQLKKLKKDLAKDLALDESFVSRVAEHKVKLQNRWKEARSEKNYSRVAQELDQMLSMIREQNARYRDSQDLKDWTRSRTDYEVCLDEYEPGFSASHLRSLLSELVAATQARLPRILEKQGPRSKISMARDEGFQRDLCHSVATRMGFDFSRGRMDKSVHPFCGGHPLDTRITLRYNLDDFSESLLSLVHEVGHGLYEQGLPQALLHTPCGKAASFGIHESQSRLWENFVARSPAFCRWLATQVGLPATSLFGHFNFVEKSWIRTESDEVTYNLHIALRMRIEEDLVEGRLRAADLRDRWNADFEQLFGLSVPSDDLGCLQDIHWFGGAFGYFPTYSLGNLMAAELMERFLAKVGVASWEASVEKGEWSALLESMRAWVHGAAGLEDSPTTILKALGGETLKVDAFVRYLDRKYLA